MLGNIVVHHTDDYVKYVASYYVPMEGASSMLRVAQETESSLTSAYLGRSLDLTDAERSYVLQDHGKQPDGVTGRPCMWVHHRLPDGDIIVVRKKPQPNKSVSDDKSEGKAAYDDDDAAAAALCGGAAGGTKREEGKGATGNVNIIEDPF